MAVTVNSSEAPHSNLHIHATCTRASPPRRYADDDVRSARRSVFTPWRGEAPWA